LRLNGSRGRRLIDEKLCLALVYYIADRAALGLLVLAHLREEGLVALGGDRRRHGAQVFPRETVEKLVLLQRGEIVPAAGWSGTEPLFRIYL